MSSSNSPDNLATDAIDLVPNNEGKRNGDDEFLELPPPTKREKMDPSYYFQEETDVVHEEAVDFAMQLLQHHDPQDPSLEFSVAPHRGSIGIKSSEFVSQICATVKACELPAGDAFARAPVDIVVALDVSGSMRVEKLDLCKKTLNLLLREVSIQESFA